MEKMTFEQLLQTNDKIFELTDHVLVEISKMPNPQAGGMTLINVLASVFHKEQVDKFGTVKADMMLNRIITIMQMELGAVPDRGSEADDVLQRLRQIKRDLN